VIRIYYSKTFKTYLHKLFTCFLAGGLVAFAVHHSDKENYARGFIHFRNINKTLAELKTANSFQERAARRFLNVFEKNRPTELEKWKRKEFEKLEKKYAQ